jgi:hypothetical protein
VSITGGASRSAGSGVNGSVSMITKEGMNSAASVTRASCLVETGASSMIVCPPSPVPAASPPSTRRNVAVCAAFSGDEKRTRYAMLTTALPSVSILSSYTASGAKGWSLVGRVHTL